MSVRVRWRKEADRDRRRCGVSRTACEEQAGIPVEKQQVNGNFLGCGRLWLVAAWVDCGGVETVDFLACVPLEGNPPPPTPPLCRRVGISKHQRYRNVGG